MHRLKKFLIFAIFSSILPSVFLNPFVQLYAGYGAHAALVCVESVRRWEGELMSPAKFTVLMLAAAGSVMLSTGVLVWAVWAEKPVMVSYGALVAIEAGAIVIGGLLVYANALNLGREEWWMRLAYMAAGLFLIGYPAYVIAITPLP